LVVDASVVLKWHLNEADSALAASLLGRADLCAPSTLMVEAGYVLTRLVRNRVISQTVARGVWSDLAASPVDLIDDEALLDDALEHALRLGAGFYDCIYLALASATGDVLVTADERFVNAVRASPALAGHICALREVTP
jgi:predicted nucleic acid-binding protein